MNTESSAGGGDERQRRGERQREAESQSKDKEKCGERKASKEAGLCIRLCVFRNMTQSPTLKKQPRGERILSLSSKLQVLLQKITEVLFIFLGQGFKKNQTNKKNTHKNLLLIQDTLSNTKCHKSGFSVALPKIYRHLHYFEREGSISEVKHRSSPFKCHTVGQFVCRNSPEVPGTVASFFISTLSMCVITAPILLHSDTSKDVR